MSEAKAEKKSKRGLIAAIIIALVVAIGGAVGYQLVKPTDESFRFPFSGCDKSGKCGDFEIYAPGSVFAWEKGKVAFASGQTPEKAAEALGARLKKATGVIAVGLASSEGSDACNRQLTARRSKVLADAVIAAQKKTGGSARVMRMALGRYKDQTTPFKDTLIQRSTVFVFVKKAPEDINIAEVMTAELGDKLRAAVQKYGKIFDLGDVAHLDFREYDCWPGKLQIVNSDRKFVGVLACHDETGPSLDC
ncbi:MAG: hypothetical protein MRY74_05060 [Neomegalonema sp.]|nr:hypothetical protein [Neomegalonema sp.]